MTNPTASDPNIDFASLRLELNSSSKKVQQQVISQLATLGEPGLEVLMEFLLQRQFASSSWIDGKAYQILYTADSVAAKNFLQTHFPNGIVALRSECGIDYSELQQLLSVQDFQAADRLTLQKLCELAGAAAVQRKWLYFTEVENFPIADLQTIDTLWSVYSEGRFGFSQQQQIWLRLGKNWEKLWSEIGWKTSEGWPRYPNGFIWNLSAPPGHLPLSNQLRGVRVIAALLSHPAWSSVAS